jgi:hypothetical protein
MADLTPIDRMEKRDPLDSVLFHKLSGGDPNSFVAQFFDLFNDILQRQPKAHAPNGIGPGQLKSTQLEAITVILKALPGREDVASKKDLQRLEQQVAQVVQAVQKIGAPDKTEHWTSQWVKILGVGFILFGLGYLLCWAQLHTEGEARVDRIIQTQKTEYHVPLWLLSHQGSISLGPLKPSEGHNETQGIIINPGDAKLAAPWVSLEGYTVVPIR